MSKNPSTNKGLQVEKKIHPGLSEKPFLGRNVIGKFQYIYSSAKGKISLIELPDYFRDVIDLWEIYSLEGDLFEDVDRFTSKEDAEKRIKELLT